MHVRQNRLSNEIEDIKLQSNMELVECHYQGGLRNDLWVVWIHGKKDTIWQGGIYPILIEFPISYPLHPPTIKFPNEFKHVHVYQGGVVCMPLLEEQNWKAKTSMLDVIYRLQSLIHQEINKYSPANESFYQLYNQQPNKYSDQIKSQVEKYFKKDLKYFQIPSIHIDVYPR